MKAAPGAGIVSSFVMQSDDLDEIDWEWIGSDTAQVQSKFPFHVYEFSFLTYIPRQLLWKRKHNNI
jgi:hypothetical protein